jgi:hypothetical protein
MPTERGKLPSQRLACACKGRQYRNAPMRWFHTLRHAEWGQSWVFIPPPPPPRTRRPQDKLIWALQYWHYTLIPTRLVTGVPIEKTYSFLVNGITIQSVNPPRNRDGFLVNGPRSDRNRNLFLVTVIIPRNRNSVLVTGTRSGRTRNWFLVTGARYGRNRNLFLVTGPHSGRNRKSYS